MKSDSKMLFSNYKNTITYCIRHKRTNYLVKQTRFSKFQLYDPAIVWNPAHHIAVNRAAVARHDIAPV